MKLRERIIEEVKEIKAEQKEIKAEQKAPETIELAEDNYPDVLDYISTEGMIAGLLLVLELLDKGENSIETKIELCTR